MPVHFIILPILVMLPAALASFVPIVAAVPVMPTMPMLEEFLLVGDGGGETGHQGREVLGFGGLTLSRCIGEAPPGSKCDMFSSSA